MTLTEKDVSRIRRLLWEVDKEVRGKGRKLYIENKNRNIRLILNKAERNHHKAIRERLYD